MKTVGELRKSGLVLIKGDLIDGITGDRDSNAVCPFDIAAASSRFGHDMSIHDGWTIRSFAWRTNRGVKPEFEGDIEILMTNGNTCVFPNNPKCSGGFSRRSTEYYYGIDKWRPHLPTTETKSPYDVDAHVSDASGSVKVKVDIGSGVNTGWHSSEKPVYTKGMYDAGELPPIGSWVSYPSGEGVVALGCDDNDVLIVNEGGEWKRVSIVGVKHILNDREKAIEEMFHVSYPNKKPSELLSVALGKLYDANYRKVEEGK